jgi:hypothetical protein
MSTTKKAEERLDRALEAVEKGIAKGFAAAGEKAEKLAAEVAALKADNARLNAALKEAEGDNAVLRQATQTVAARLDGTIGALQSTLER